MKKLQITLTPAESKRLIAIGLKKHPIIQNALQNGRIAIALGTTNAYVVEELTGRTIDKQRYASGITTNKTCIVPRSERAVETLIVKGVVQEAGIKDAINELTPPHDVFIKGANAIDPNGTAGVMLASPVGGTIAAALGVVMARGVHMIIPVGLEKTIPVSINEVAKHAGNMRIYKSIGAPIGIMPVHGHVITEIEALLHLGAVNAYPIGAGGVNGGEGSVTIIADVEDRNADKLMDVIMGVKGEPQTTTVEGDCIECARDICVYNKLNELKNKEEHKDANK